MKYRLLEISTKDSYHWDRKQLVGEIFETDRPIVPWGDGWVKVVDAKIENKYYLFFEVRVEQVQ